MEKQRKSVNLSNLENNAAMWTGLWAMEANTLKAFASGKALGNPSTPIEPEKSYMVSNGAAIIPVVGPIAKYPSILQMLCGGVSTLAVQHQIDQALYDDTVDSIVLFIDSPGGTVAGTSDLANYIGIAKSLKPITAYISDHCFSAAYWIASQCTRIVANEGAFVGSIGVYTVLLDTSKAAESAGVQVTLISAGEYKGLEEPGLPLADKAIVETQRQVNAAYELFVKSVQEGRRLPTNVVKQLADGRVHVASDAQSLKLIDAIGTLDVALAGVKEQSNMDQNNSQKAADAAPEEKENAPTAPEDVELLKQVLAALAALTQKIDQLAPADDDKEDADDDGGDDMAKAVAADRERLKAIKEACGSRAEFAVEQFLAGKSAVEAKAALADLLNAENTELRKQAGSSEGTEPLAVGKGPGVTALDGSDLEQVWANNVGGVQEKFRGKKEYFLAQAKYNAKKAKDNK
jgi:signal peptide peptidase SppA